MQLAAEKKRSTHPRQKTPMTMEQALETPWLSYYPKPLGVLMAEGYLNEARLAWAAEKAYNPRLKEAAIVLLSKEGLQGESEGKESTHQTLDQPARDVGINLAEAEAIPWPFRNHKGEAMGPLVRSRELTLKDLAYAIENAWDDRVRRAAIALSFLRLNQEVVEGPPPAGPLNVISVGKRSYAQRRQLQIATIQGAVVGAVLALALAYLVNSLVHGSATTTPRLTISEVLASPELTLALSIVILGLIGIGLLEIFGVQWLVKHMDRAIEAYRKGEVGEEAVVERARRALDGSWTLFRSVVLPGKKADLDIVLVGPPGVWALEVKTWMGAYKNVGEIWEYRSVGGGWKRMSKNPGRQARRGALALKDFLKAEGTKTYVHAAVVWAEPEAAVFQENPTVAVWPLERVEDEFGNLSNGKPLPETERAKIVEKLTRLVQPHASD